MKERPSAHNSTLVRLLNLVIAGLVVAWLAVACDAIAHLISH